MTLIVGSCLAARYSCHIISNTFLKAANFADTLTACSAGSIIEDHYPNYIDAGHGHFNMVALLSRWPLSDFILKLALHIFLLS